MPLWVLLDIYASFELIWSSSAESDVNRTLQIWMWKWREKKRERFLVSKVEFVFRRPRGIKILLFDLVYKIGLVLSNKAPIINCSGNSKNAKFFVQKLKSWTFFKEFVNIFSCVHFSVPTVRWPCFFKADWLYFFLLLKILFFCDCFACAFEAQLHLCVPNYLFYLFLLLFLVPDLPLDDSVAPASRPDLLEIPVSEGFSGVYIDSS